MFSADDDGQQGLVLGIVFGLVALVVALVIITAVHRAGRPAIERPAPAVTAAVLAPVAGTGAQPPAIPDAVRPGPDDASIKVEYGVVMFYFASGRSELAAGAGEALADLVKRLSPGHKLVISGFHDASGDAAKNVELAKQRAVAVRDALLKSGVQADQLQLNRPRQAGADGPPEQARRVEVALE
jgi:outer membrane protein OmpA-like peptidoglycan-associated protein